MRESLRNLGKQEPWTCEKKIIYVKKTVYRGGEKVSERTVLDDGGAAKTEAEVNATREKAERTLNGMDRLFREFDNLFRGF